MNGETHGLKTAAVDPIQSKDWPTRAERPRNSMLDSGNFLRDFGFAMPEWRSSLAEGRREAGESRVSPGVLYISYDGMLEPLGQSQVLAYLERLAPGRRIHLISFEKPGDWANRANADAVRAPHRRRRDRLAPFALSQEPDCAGDRLRHCRRVRRSRLR